MTTHNKKFKVNVDIKYYLRNKTKAKWSEIKEYVIYWILKQIMPLFSLYQL